MDYSLTEQIAEVKLELKLRARVYPRWVAEGRMKQEAADFRTGRLLAILATLERLEKEERLL
jgi:hypothetical protein